MVERFWFGKITCIDLHGVDREIITNPESIKIFIYNLCKTLKMKRHGETLVDRFGSGRLEGYSALQFIETSSITCHFDEFADRAFIDVFSCKEYDSQKIVNFCKKYLKAKHGSYNTINRQ